MRRNFLSLAVVMAISFTACYEGADLEQMYQEFDQSQTLDLDSATQVKLTSAQIRVQINNPKYNSKIDLYYSDQPEGDLQAIGQKYTLEVADVIHIYDTAEHIQLSDLMPDTRYRYQAIYSDTSGKEIRSDERSFHTKSFSIYGRVKSTSYSDCEFFASFYHLVSGAQLGFIYGTESSLTLDNALGSVSTAYSGTSDYVSLTKRITGLEPDTQYYLCSYILYRGRAYYGDVLMIRTLHK